MMRKWQLSLVNVAGDSKMKSMSQPPNSTIKPNFFIIGAPKCGTTSLAQYLSEHPNIFFCPIKEPHYFDLDMYQGSKIQLHLYLSLFYKVNPAVHKAVGEGSTSYLFSRVAMSEILKFNPGAKFIVMLRNPVNLVQSLHSDQCYNGFEDVCEFETAWKLETARRGGRAIPVTCWEAKQLIYSDWGKLGDQVERLFAVVPREQVRVIVFDDFVADTKSIYEMVLSFLEVPSDGRTSFAIANGNKLVRYPWLQRSLALVVNYSRRTRACSRLKLGLGLGMSTFLMKLNSRPSVRKPISPALRAELTDYFREDIGKLSQILGRDLSHWGLHS